MFIIYLKLCFNVLLLKHSGRISTLKTFTHYTQNCKDFSQKVSEKIVAHIKTVEKFSAVVKKSCSVYNWIFCSLLCARFFRVYSKPWAWAVDQVYAIENFVNLFNCIVDFCFVCISSEKPFMKIYNINDYANILVVHVFVFGRCWPYLYHHHSYTWHHQICDDMRLLDCEILY